MMLSQFLCQMDSGFLSRLESAHLIPVILFAVMGLVGIVAIVANAWVRFHRTQAEAALKQEMLSRGMSAEEIERVIRASSAPQADE
ncbi:MAG: hypothetical protein HY000_34675 [Planctomycetes bacterium]|nr:hypothetical protein [Planctomycetota bacterium]